MTSRKSYKLERVASPGKRKGAAFLDRRVKLMYSEGPLRVPAPEN